jgi:hydrogenase maturation protein HypF
VVQGLGVRPALFRLARQLELGGTLTNRAMDLVIDLHGPRPVLERFLAGMAGALPAGVRLDSAQPRWLPLPPAASPAAAGAGPRQLRISADGRGVPVRSLGIGLVACSLAADRAPCPACRRELADPTSRRFGDPFISCCACGPRYGIATAEPWQRSHTTLAAFPPCPACVGEFADPADRRFHAETIGCPRCGPRLALLDAHGAPWPSLPPLLGRGSTLIAAAAELLDQGLVLALQGVGGFQLLVDAANPAALERLRRLKRRPARPFALLVGDPAWLEPHVELTPAARALLATPAAPIVLLPRRFHPTTGGGANVGVPAGGAVDPYPGLAPGCPQLGVMLPATPLHLLLVERFGRPLVCTSGNRSGEPLCLNPPEALERLAGLADAFLLHDRPVARPLDDSVAQLIDGQPVLLRRSRGYVPEPLELPQALRLASVPAPAGPEAASATGPSGLLALGGDLKAAPALALGRRVWLAPHLGDLAEPRTNRRFRAGIAELLAQEQPHLAAVAFDQHCGYLSHQFGQSLPLAPLAVQHHRAHALAVAAEQHLPLPLLAFCADGLGYGEPEGDDGNPSRLWGGEVLHLTEAGAERLAWLRPLPLPGGEQAMAEPRRVALGLLVAAGPWALGHPASATTRAAFAPSDWRGLLEQVGRGLNCPWSTSVGRLFDGVASLLGLCQRSSYEGEAALRLQGAAVRATGWTGNEPAPAAPGPLGWLDWEPLLRRLLDDRAAGEPPERLALAFHHGLAEAMAVLLAAAAEQRRCSSVVLAGGCFQNALLLEALLARLRRRGLRPHWARAVPGNDGGLALGQVWASHLPGSDQSHPF